MINQFAVAPNTPLAYHHSRMRFLIEVQFGGVSPRCLIVDSATTRRIADRAVADYRALYAGERDFLSCEVREETLELSEAGL